MKEFHHRPQEPAPELRHNAHAAASNKASIRVLPVGLLLRLALLCNHRLLTSIENRLPDGVGIGFLCGFDVLREDTEGVHHHRVPLLAFFGLGLRPRGHVADSGLFGVEWQIHLPWAEHRVDFRGRVVGDFLLGFRIQPPDQHFDLRVVLALREVAKENRGAVLRVHLGDDGAVRQVLDQEGVHSHDVSGELLGVDITVSVNIERYETTISMHVPHWPKDIETSKVIENGGSGNETLVGAAVFPKGVGFVDVLVRVRAVETDVREEVPAIGFGRSQRLGVGNVVEFALNGVAP